MRGREGERQSIILYMCIYMHTHTHVHTHARTHTHTHTHAHFQHVVDDVELDDRLASYQVVELG